MDVQTYGLYIGVMGVAAAIVVPIVIYYLQNKKKKLVFEEIQNLSVINVKKDFKDQIEIKYADEIVDNLYVSTARLKNKGTLPIKENEIIKPIEINFDKKILKPDVIEVHPKGIEVQLNTISEGKSVQCKFNLLNPNDYFTLQFVSLEELPTPVITSRIEGLSKIDVIDSNTTPARSTMKINILLIVVGGFLIYVSKFAVDLLDAKYLFNSFMESFLSTSIGLCAVVFIIYLFKKAQ